MNELNGFQVMLFVDNQRFHFKYTAALSGYLARRKKCVCVFAYVCVFNSQCIVRDDFLGEELFYSFIHSAHHLTGLIFCLCHWLLQQKTQQLNTRCAHVCLL